MDGIGSFFFSLFNNGDCNFGKFEVFEVLLSIFIESPIRAAT